MLSGLRSEQSYALTTTDRGACGGDQVNPFIIAIHCSSHRIALCMKDTTENTPWVLVHQTYLTESYALLARSPKKNAVQGVCGAVGCHLHQPQETPHRAVVRVHPVR